MTIIEYESQNSRDFSWKQKYFCLKIHNNRVFLEQS